VQRFVIVSATGVLHLLWKFSLTDKKRNPNTYQLALKLFPHAAIQYANDDSVTYGFTDNPDAEVPEEVAIANFIARETKRARKSY
jgi:hypothetical protein